MTSRVTMVMVGWALSIDLLMITGIIHFLLMGYSIIRVGPVLLYVFPSTYTCIPMAILARKERSERIKKTAVVSQRRHGMAIAAGGVVAR